MPKLNLLVVASASLAAGWLAGTLLPWWATALMIGGCVAYVLVRRRAQ